MSYFVASVKQEHFSSCLVETDLLLVVGHALEATSFCLQILKLLEEVLYEPSRAGPNALAYTLFLLLSSVCSAGYIKISVETNTLTSSGAYECRRRLKIL